MPILYKGITAILALTGCLSLLITGEVNLLMCLGGLTLFPGYYRFFKGYPQASKRAGAILAQAALLVFLADASIISGDVFLAVAHMTITFQGIKSFDLKEPWDHLQVYFMSLLQLIIASELTRALTFGVIFIVFMILLVTAMVFSHFLKEGALGKVRLRRPVIVIVALTMVFTSLFFIVLPRTPQRFIGKSHFRGIKTIGFSDKVDFGSFGDIKLDQTIVMRIQLNRAVPPPYYWRGKTMDYFDGISWRNTTQQKSRIFKFADEFLFFPYDRNTALVQDVFLEPIDSDAVFGLAKIAAVNAETFSLTVGDDRDISMPGRFSKRVRYTVYSDPSDHYTGKREGKYLQMPPGLTRVSNLADAVTGKAATDEQRALLIESFLRNNYTYSLSTSQPPAGMSVIEDFLFGSRKGYCEHYAASMVLMLRSINIPARIVNGFYGGERNDYGNYLIIRQSDAHAWVEALIGNTWRRFDPTPAVTLQRPQTVALLFDSLKMQWTRYVIGFSFHDQKEILKKVTLPFRLKGLPHVQFSMLKTYIPVLLAVIVVCLIIYYGLSSFRSRRYGFVTASYLELRALLKKRGFRLTDSKTAGDIRDMTHSSCMAGAVHEFLRLYELHRFGKRQVTAEQKKQYARLLAEIKAAKR
jgi:transglutaminase-like putative cysteine protease